MYTFEILVSIAVDGTRVGSWWRGIGTGQRDEIESLHLVGKTKRVTGCRRRRCLQTLSEATASVAAVEGSAVPPGGAASIAGVSSSSGARAARCGARAVRRTSPTRDRDRPGAASGWGRCSCCCCCRPRGPPRSPWAQARTRRRGALRGRPTPRNGATTRAASARTRRPMAGSASSSATRCSPPPEAFFRDSPTQVSCNNHRNHPLLFNSEVAESLTIIRTHCNLNFITTTDTAYWRIIYLTSLLVLQIRVSFLCELFALSS